MSPPYIPATALGGDLVRDWTGPVIYGDIFPANTPVRWVVSAYGAGGMANGTNKHGIRLDPRRPEVAHRIADVLRAKGHEVGHLLPVALGGRQGDVTAYEPCERCESAGGTCYRCREGSEMDRPPRRTIPAADVSAVLLSASVAGVEAERGVVRGVLGEWARADLSPGVERWARQGIVGDALAYSRAALAEGQQVGWGLRPHPSQTTDSGPETGPEGRAAADAALLRLGYAYLDPTAPFGVVVPFLRDGREAGS